MELTTIVSSTYASGKYMDSYFSIDADKGFKDVGLALELGY